MRDEPGQEDALVPAGQRALLAQLRAVVEAKDAENAALRAELDAERGLRRRLELRLAELERRLSMDSTDSGTPSSKERIGAKEARRARQQSGRERRQDRKRGGQLGHLGKGLERDPDPDEQQTADPPAECRSCQAALDGADAVEPRWAQVIDAEIIRTVTEWALPGLACRCCGTVTFAEPPPGAHHRDDADPEDRQKAAASAPHVLITRTPDGRLTFLQAIGSRRKDAIAAGLPAGFAGHLITDGYAGYQHLLGRLAGSRQCAAHVIRRCRAVTKLGPGGVQNWAGDVTAILRHAHQAVDAARARGDTALDQQALDDLLKRYDTAVAAGIIHNRLRDWDTGNHPGYALGTWLRDYKEQVFLFTCNFAVDWTNYPNGAVMPMSVVRGGSAAGQGGALAA